MRYLIAILIIASLVFFGGVTYLAVTRLNSPRPARIVIEGKTVWKEKGCIDCHTIFGDSSFLASDLTHIVSMHSPAQIRKFLRARPVMPPAGVERHPALSGDEIEPIIQFLIYADQVRSREWAMELAEQ